MFFPLLTKATVTNSEIEGKVKIYLFSSNNCVDCEQAKKYLQREANKNYYLEIIYSENEESYLKVKKRLNIKKDG